MMTQRYVYVVISKTATRFGYVLRRVGGVHYNHAAIALDEELKELYSFARKQYHAALIGGLVEETVERYTLRKQTEIPVTVFRILVSAEQYLQIKQEIEGIKQDQEYKYNLFSVLTFPITKGFAVYKAYSCIEFVMNMMKKADYTLTKPAYQYTPDELLELFAAEIWFQGNLLDYCSLRSRDDTYFQPMNLDTCIRSGSDLREIVRRSLFTRVKANEI